MRCAESHRKILPHVLLLFISEFFLRLFFASHIDQGPGALGR